MLKYFDKFSRAAATALGSITAFLLACLVVLVWAALGPIFEWSDSHSLSINTFTTIITFLAVFLVQRTQNLEAKATQLKLDELIRVTEARNSFIDAEHLDKKDLDKLRKDLLEDIRKNEII